MSKEEAKAAPPKAYAKAKNTRETIAWLTNPRGVGEQVLVGPKETAELTREQFEAWSPKQWGVAAAHGHWIVSGIPQSIADEIAKHQEEEERAMNGRARNANLTAEELKRTQHFT